ncbi:hypothetical protein, partial [Shewanella chilikensis]|uniref:hypothetical protein n=1 Tax=Shewanella chilikensis TaxID=558541 RepID=UPI001F265383
VLFLFSLPNKNILNFDFLIWLKFGLCLSFFICTLQFLQSLGLVNGFSFLIEKETRGEATFSLITGGFTNPNNLAVVWLVSFSFLYLWFLNKKTIKTKFSKNDFFICYGMTAIILFLTLSRLCLAFFFILSFLLVLRRKPILLLFFPFLIIFLSNSDFFLGMTPLIDHNVNKLNSLFNVFDGSADSGQSSRSVIYSYTLDRLHDVTLGHGLGNYQEFYSLLIERRVENSFYSSLDFLSSSPHSFIFESFIAFGWLMGGAFVFLFFLSVFILIQKEVGKGGGEVFILIVAVTFVPSSVFKIPL